MILSGQPQINYDVIWRQVSRLPLEAKLFFALVILPKEVQAANGVEVGCAATSVFDDRGCLRQGKHALVFWPFRKFDLRIGGCIGSFNYQLDRGDYTKIILNFPKFTTEVQWSLRSEDLIRSLGYLEYNPQTNQPTAGE